MRYDFGKMDADSFELMVRSLNEAMFGVKCEQFGMGPDGQREFTFNGKITDKAGNVFEGSTIGQVKYKYVIAKEDDYTWLKREIDGELKRFREKGKEDIPDNYFFYTNVVLTPTKDTGVKDKINAYVNEKNDIIKNFYVKGYDEICAMLDNYRDVAQSYAASILSGDVLMKLYSELKIDYDNILKKYMLLEFNEDMYTRIEQAGSVTEKKISIEKVCIDIEVKDREQRGKIKFAQKLIDLGNQVCGYKRVSKEGENTLSRDENFVILGGPGKGKSTICQFIAQIYRAQYLKNMGDTHREVEEFISEINESYKYIISNQRIPIKIVLKEYAAWISRKEDEENISVLQYIKEKINKHTGEELISKNIREILNQYACIFFFDGLDEVPESSNRQEVLKQIHNFISIDLLENECDCIVIGTTRTQGYNNDFDESKYKHLEVEELSKEDCYVYINKLFKIMEEQSERREEYIQIMKEALEDDTTSRLMKTPLQVTIIAILVKSGGKPPHERYSLFKQYYETTIRREKQKGIVATLNDNTDWIEEIHLLIGNRLQKESEKEENASAEISQNELEKTICDYVNENGDCFYETEETLKEKEKDFFLIITQRICFLCENREGFYSFNIRTIQEYFAGTFLVKGRSDKEALSNIELIAYNSYWRNALLFALGYIELERKCLEKEIGLLCERMNGKQNIVREEFTIENFCLFGSWLAVDILSEDIFRGRQQDKYIVLASQAKVFFNSPNYNKFSTLSGAQRDKLLRYISEKCSHLDEEKEENIRLCLKLAENEKNKLDNEIISNLEKLNEESKIRLYIHILTVEAGEEISNYVCDKVIKLLEIGKVKELLPYAVLDKIVRYGKNRINNELKRTLFVQYLYCESYRINIRYIQNILQIKSFDLKKAFEYLAPFKRAGYENEYKIEISDNFEVSLVNEEINRQEIKEIQTELEKLGITYLSKFCDFLYFPTFVKFQELCRLIEQEESYLATKYKRSLCYYVEISEIKTEEDFGALLNKRKNDYQQIISGDYKELFYGNINVNISYSVSCNDSVFDELLEKGPVDIERIEDLNNVFLRAYMFVLRVQLESTRSLNSINDKQVDSFVKIFSVAANRKIYDYRYNEVFSVFMTSKFKKKFWEKNPEFLFTDCMLNERQAPYRLHREIRCVGTEELEDILCNIVNKMVNSEKEDNYLPLFLLLIDKKVNVRKCVSENQIKQLDNIDYQTDINIMSVQILKMCISENEESEKLINNLLKLQIPKWYVFTVLEQVLYYCDIKNREEIWAKVYLRLIEETFRGSEEIKERFLIDMFELKESVPSK